MGRRRDRSGREYEGPWPIGDGTTYVFAGGKRLLEVVEQGHRDWRRDEPWEWLGGTFIQPPEVVSWGTGRLDIFGVGLDGGMYHKAWTGSEWSPGPQDWEWLGGIFTSPPSVTAWGRDRLDIIGLGQDGSMFHKAWDGAAWRP